ncbi:MAG: hypothetical protein CSA95_01160 [Bacteroidetes bacterium]|nr:MAG: hypothetical protein CSA95_01160 [Bacteroidota bacterium]PIE88187.1 MAG: hypothetical protein CSA04_03250 [Bacteroidota bacterium]
MKHFFTLLSVFTFAVLLVNAQTVVTYEAHCPKVGDSNISYDSDVSTSIDIHAPGGNQTWDLSAYNVPSEGFVIHYVDPETTPWGAEVPNSNLAVWEEDDEGSYAMYFSVTPSQVSALAYASKTDGAPESLVFFDDELVLMHFPFAYNDQFEDNSSMQYDYEDETGLTYHFEHSGEHVNKADAWGDLVTPLGSFNDVLRIKEESTESVKIYTNGTLVMTTYSTTVSYSFYHPSSKLPIAVVEYDSDFEDEIAVSFNQMATGIAEHETAIKVAYPNPASDYMTLDLRPFKDESVVQLLDISGKAVASFIAGNEEQRVDLSNYSEGVYLVVGEGENQRILTQKITLAR